MTMFCVVMAPFASVEMAHNLIPKSGNIMHGMMIEQYSQRKVLRIHSRLLLSWMKSRNSCRVIRMSLQPLLGVAEARPSCYLGSIRAQALRPRWRSSGQLEAGS